MIGTGRRWQERESGVRVPFAICPFCGTLIFSQPFAPGQEGRQLDPASILKLFREAVQKKQIKISLHAAEEALTEHITRAEIEAALFGAQLLEDYLDWWLGPSCLVYGQTQTGRDLHIVASYSELPITIITVYEPRPPKWRTPTVRGGDE